MVIQFLIMVIAGEINKKQSMTACAYCIAV